MYVCRLQQCVGFHPVRGEGGGVWSLEVGVVLDM